MCITGISVFSTMYVKLFMQGTLVKNLYIRIHSDRRNNYLYSNVYIKLKSISIDKLCDLQQ
jgi:hypothetical protein